MNIDLQKKLETACIYLNLWKRGEKCELIVCPHGPYLPEPHDIPCPDLTDALAMKMLRELAKRSHNLYIEHYSDNGWWCVWERGRRRSPICVLNPAIAIVLAVYELAMREGGK